MINYILNDVRKIDVSAFDNKEDMAKCFDIYFPTRLAEPLYRERFDTLFYDFLNTTPTIDTFSEFLRVAGEIGWESFCEENNCIFEETVAV